MFNKSDNIEITYIKNSNNYDLYAVGDFNLDKIILYENKFGLVAKLIFENGNIKHLILKPGWSFG